MANRPIGVQQLDHVTIVVADLDRSRDFYVGVLGMEEVPRPNFSFAGLWFRAGSTLVHLILEHPESGPAGNDIPEGTFISRTRHMAFTVENAAEAAERIREWGIEIVSGPKARPDGATQLFVLDPDRHLIELCSV